VSNTHEILTILQEECAEVIQAVSKINRFGLTGLQPNGKFTNKENLENEIGDVLTMIDLLKNTNVLSWDNIELAKKNKLEKLKVWSTISLGE
jgi:NTP pyrophosphatase (non-canonical NTP hydrolase)